MRNIVLDSTFNTRDIAQLKTTNNKQIKKHRLFRSGCLIKLTKKDISTLKRYNIKTIIDFRSEEEFNNRPDVRIPGINYINLPALPKEEHKEKAKSSDSNLLRLVNKDSGGEKLLLNTYKNMFITKEGLTAYKDFFKIIENNDDGAILWHCSQGKDRAGLAAFLLEYVLGVSLEECYKDYMFTNKAMELKIKQLTPIVLKESNNDISLLPQLHDVFTAKMIYLNEAIKTINEHYHNIDNFLKNVLEVNIEKIQNKYLK